RLVTALGARRDGTTVPFRKRSGLIDAPGRRAVATPGPAGAPQTMNAEPPRVRRPSRAQRGISSGGPPSRREPELGAARPDRRSRQRTGGGLVDAPGRGLVGAKGEYPLHRPYL